MTAPELRLLLPANHENAWSDLVAVLIETDSAPLLTVLGLEAGLRLTVKREPTFPWQRLPGESERRSDRLDLLVEADGRSKAVAVIEAKVLAPVGEDQLARYAERVPADCYRLLELERFRTSPGDDPWQSLTWESLLDAYTRSDNPWVSSTARAWRSQIDLLVPPVDGETVWNDVRDGAEGDIDLRARGAWLYAQMDGWCDIEPGFSGTNGGRSWVVTMDSATSRDDYSVSVEVDEGLSVRKWNDGDRPRSQRLQGPTVLIGLRQDSISNADGFDWELLVRLFKSHVVDDRGEPTDGRTWRRHKAIRSSLAGWTTNVQGRHDVPNWLGQGYNEAAKHDWCLFGARFNLSPALTLAQIDVELRKVQDLVHSLAEDV